MTTKNKCKPHDVLEAPPPSLSEAEALALAQRHYGVTGAAHPLVSERDQNFRVRTAEDRQFVLKIANSAEDGAVVDFQIQALNRIAALDPALPVPRLCSTREGKNVHTIEHCGRSHLVYMLTFLEGQTLDAVSSSVGLRRELGTVLARLSRSLRGLFHPAAGRELLWDLKHALRLRAYLAQIDEPDHRRLAKQVLDRFEGRVLPALPGLRAQIVHNDLNPNNVIVHPDDNARVAGVIDFGDMVHAPLIADLAVAVAYQLFDQADPLAAACDVVAGYHAILPLEEAELALLLDLVATRLAVSGIIASWRAKEHPENRDYILIDAPFIWSTLETVTELSRSAALQAFREACEFGIAHNEDGAASTPSNSASLRARRERSLGRTLELSYDEPLHIVRGEGAWLYDADGRAYLDAYNNVAHVGHCHPRVTAALDEQARRLNTNTRYLHDHIVEYAERLASTLPGDLGVCLFVCTGSEANDLALRIARVVTGGDGAIVTDNAYHGNTDATTQVSPEELSGDERSEWVATVAAPNLYSGPHRAGEQNIVKSYAAYVDRALAELETRGHRTGAFLFDSIFTSDGIVVAPDGYLAAVFEKVRAAGGVCIADEVQAGFGRTGESLWYFARHGIVPDIVTLGKPMGNGHPIAAAITTPEIARAFSRNQHYFNTFGGNPVSCAVGLSVLDVLEEEGLQANAKSVGEHLLTRLAMLMARHAIIGDVRGAGLFVGIELVKDRTTRAPAPDEARAILNTMRERGVLIGRTGLHGHVLKVRPPLVFSRENADQLVDTLDEVLRQYGSAPEVADAR